MERIDFPAEWQIPWVTFIIIRHFSWQIESPWLMLDFIHILITASSTATSKIRDIFSKLLCILSFNCLLLSFLMLKMVPEKPLLPGNKEEFPHFWEIPLLETFSALSALELWYISFYINMGNKNPHSPSCSTSLLNIFCSANSGFFRHLFSWFVIIQELWAKFSFQLVLSDVTLTFKTLLHSDLTHFNLMINLSCKKKP